MKIYKVQTKYVFTNSLLFLGPVILGLISFLEAEPVSHGEWLGISLFTLIATLVTFVPLANRLEVGDNYLKSYFLGININHIKRDQVEVLEYGNLLRFGGLGVGKGIKMWVKTSRGRKLQTIGEQAFGANAIEAIKNALS